MIDVTVKTLDSQNYKFSVPDSLSVIDFKRRISGSVGLEPSLQRLIFCGRVLDDEKRLNDYDVDGKVIHLVQRPPPAPARPASEREDEGRSRRAAPQRPQQSLPSRHHGNRSYGGVVSPGLSAGLRLFVAREMLARSTRSLSAPATPSSAPSAVRESAGRGSPSRTVEESSTGDSPGGPGSSDGRSSLDMGPGVELSFTVEEIVLDIADGEPAAEAVVGPTVSADPQSSVSNEPMDVSVESQRPDASASQPAGGNSSDDASPIRMNVSNTTPPPEMGDVLEAMLDAFEQFVPRVRSVISDIRSGAWNPPSASTEHNYSTSSQNSAADGNRAEAQQSFERLARSLHFLSHAIHAISDVRAPSADANFLTAAPHYIGGHGGFDFPSSIQVRRHLVEGPAVTVSMGFGHNPRSRDASPRPASGNADAPNASAQRGAQSGQQANPGQAPTDEHNHAPNRQALPLGIVLSQIGNISANLAQAFAEHAADTAREPNAGRNGPGLAGQLSGVSAMVAEILGGLNALAGGGGNGGGSRQPSSTATVTVEGQPASGSNGGAVMTAVVQSLIGARGGAARPQEPSRGPRSSSDQTASAGVQSSTQALAQSSTSAASDAGSATAGPAPDGRPSSQPTRSAQQGSRPVRVGVSRLIGADFDPFLPCQSRHLPSFRREGQAHVGVSTGAPSFAIPGLVAIPGRPGVLRGTAFTSAPQAGAQQRARSAGPTGRAPSSQTANSTAPSEPSNANEAGAPPGLQLDNFMRVVGSEMMRNAVHAPGSHRALMSSPIFHLFRLSPNLTFADILAIWGEDAPASLPSDLRPRIRALVSSYVLGNSEPTALNISNAVDDFVSRRITYSDLPTFEGIRQDVDAVETVRNHMRACGREFLTQLYSDDISDNAFFAWVKSRSSEMLREVLMVLSLCFTDSYEGVDRFLRAHLVGMVSNMFIPGVLPDTPAFVDTGLQRMREWIIERLPADHSECEADLRRFLVLRQPDAPIPLQPTGESAAPAVVPQAAAPPRAEAMDVEVDEDAVAPSHVEPAQMAQAQGRVESPRVPPASDGGVRRSTAGAAGAIPSPVDNWEEVLPREWIDVVKNDIRAQETHPPQRRPFSDAYLSGMDTKRRRLVTADKAPSDADGLLRGALKTAVNASIADPIAAATIVENASSQPSLRLAFANHLREEVQRRVRGDPDYDPRRYPNLGRMVGPPAERETSGDRNGTR